MEIWYSLHRRLANSMPLIELPASTIIDKRVPLSLPTQYIKHSNTVLSHPSNNDSLMPITWANIRPAKKFILTLGIMMWCKSCVLRWGIIRRPPAEEIFDTSSTPSQHHHTVTPPHHIRTKIFILRNVFNSSYQNRSFLNPRTSQTPQYIQQRQ